MFGGRGQTVWGVIKEVCSTVKRQEFDRVSKIYRLRPGVNM